MAKGKLFIYLTLVDVCINLTSCKYFIKFKLLKFDVNKMFMFSCHISRINNAIYLNQHQCYCSHRSPNNIKSCFQSYIIACWLMVIFRDGPFDTSIRGGWAGGRHFSPMTSYFFSVFAKQVIFSKVYTATSFFYFFENNTFKLEKCKRKQPTE